MNIGSKIRFHRQKKNLTQEELSKGIISVSYLSKLENNQVFPSEEIIQLLCERLGVSSLQNDEQELNKLLEKWNRSLLWKDLEAAESYHDEIKKLLNETDDLTAQLLYKILFIRYQLIHSDLASVRTNLARIHSHYKELNDTLRFYYHRYKGNYYYAVQQYDKALTELKEAETYYVLGSVTNEEERADLYYLFSLVLTRLNMYRLAIYYGEKSLSIFQGVYFQQRCAEVHLLLGICYRRIRYSEEALKHYDWANFISKSINYNRLTSMVEQNLGYLKSVMNKSEEAIHHYLRSIELKESDVEGKLNSILALVKEYYKLNRFNQVRYWLPKGLALCSKDVFPGKYYQLSYYQYALDDFPTGFEHFMKEYILPYFKENGEQLLYAEYSKFLGQYYQGVRRYKNAAFHLKESNSIYEEMLSL
ncbi:helix-turn-helix domain-containing protein [[Bacillus] enclensis]|jgi:HTH-type transcriptional regulator, quorum sensing regulator NprR|uniref:helix-turn-helix domain-containing protein n=1 Tax=[Bacillus] enclensis TaxID=1402860 RepID=UPI0018DE12A1|nr:helix-turn-helix transcriptional regulator [[Bacillus] enclensis]MBH9964760.1 helix-turn-helix transcriptional regulator [[Bacillus] enclensis]